VPAFYDRDSSGIPRPWVARIRASMSELTPQFSSNRMVREYVDQLYIPSAESFRKRTAGQAAEAEAYCRWRYSLQNSWHKLRFGSQDIQLLDESYVVTVTAYIDDLNPDAVQIQLYAESQDGNGPEVHVLSRTGLIPGTVNGYFYRTRIPARRPIEHYTARIIPHFEGSSVPLEISRILWYE
jgi:glycogen phosphorylase